MLSDFDLAKQSGAMGGMHASISKSEVNGVRTLLYLVSCFLVGLRLQPHKVPKTTSGCRHSACIYRDRARLQGTSGAECGAFISLHWPSGSHVGQRRMPVAHRRLLRARPNSNQLPLPPLP